MNAKRLSAILVCAVLGAASSLARAGMVDFNVPLNVTTYPGQNVEVWCELQSAQNQAIAAGMTIAPVHGGALQGFTHVKVIYSAQQAGAISRYRCALVVETKSSLGAVSASGKEGGGGYAKSIPFGATILQQVGGPLQ